MSDKYQAIITVEKITSTDVEGDPSNTEGLLQITVSADTTQLLKARVANVLSAVL